MELAVNMSETGIHQVVVVLTAADIEHVDNWAAANGFLDRAEAVQQLIRQGLRVAARSDDEGGIEAAPD